MIFSLTLVTLILPFFLGCSTSVSDGNPQADPVELQHGLGPEEARKALIALAGERQDIFELAISADRLKTYKVVVLDPGVVGLGPWTCNLPKLDFCGSFEYKLRVVDIIGKFKQEPDGKWTATVTKVMEAFTR